MDIMKVRRGIRTALGATNSGSSLVEELIGRLAEVGFSREQVLAGIEDASAAGELVVVARPAPDVHLTGFDLRAVGTVDTAIPSDRAIEDGLARAAAEWDRFASAFLSQHTCE
jgi:hypothetical protein